MDIALLTVYTECGTSRTMPKQYQLGITLIREIYPRKSNVKCSLLTHEKSIVPPKNEPESLEPAVWRCFIKSLPLNFFVKSTPWQSVSCECSEFLQSTSFIENYGGNVSWWYTLRPQKLQIQLLSVSEGTKVYGKRFFPNQQTFV